MGFWSDFRLFLRTRTEILDRLDRSERGLTTLAHRIDEVDEFVHVQSRKRYQETYVPSTEKTPPENRDQPTLPNLPLKEQLRRQARERGFIR